MRKSQLEATALTGMIEGKKELEVDKGKHLWTGCHSLVPREVETWLLDCGVTH